MLARPLRYVLIVLSVVLSLAAAAGLVLFKFENLRLYSVQTGSMAPQIASGDLVVDVKASPAALKPGDVISYVSANGSGQVITHRVVANRQGYVITKGDNLAQPDPPVPYRAIVGQGRIVLPGAGYLLDYLRKPLVLIILVYVPGIVIAAAEIRRLAIYIGRRPYQSDSGV